MPQPVYIRFGKAPLYTLSKAETQFEFGKAALLRDGRDIAFIATGETVAHAYLAAELLKSKNISVRVVSMHTIKPLDTTAILSAAKECRAIITVEEHSIHGGLSEAVASVILQSGLHPKFKPIAIPDEHTVTGSQADIFRHYGITMEGLADSAMKLM